jgi:hypothetical protein
MLVVFHSSRVFHKTTSSLTKIGPKTFGEANWIVLSICLFLRACLIFLLDYNNRFCYGGSSFFFDAAGSLQVCLLFVIFSMYPYISVYFWLWFLKLTSETSFKKFRVSYLGLLNYISLSCFKAESERTLCILNSICFFFCLEVSFKISIYLFTYFAYLITFSSRSIFISCISIQGVLEVTARFFVLSCCVKIGTKSRDCESF